MDKRGIAVAILIGILITGFVMKLEKTWAETQYFSGSSETVTIYYAEDGPEERLTRVIYALRDRERADYI